MIVLWLAVLAAAAGCAGGLYDEKNVYCCREHLAERNKGGDLLSALDKSDVNKVILAGAYNSTFNPAEPTDWTSAEQNNEMLLDALARAGSRILVFPLLRGDEPNLIETAAKMFAAGARGFYLANGLPNQRRAAFDDPRLLELYAWCDFRHIPILADLDYALYGAEFENVVQSYPSLTFFGGRMMGLIDDLPALELLMQRRRNLYLDFSFPGDDAKVHAYEAIARREAEFKAFVKKNYDRVLWGTEILVSRTAARNSDWLTQYIADSRFYLEKSSVKMKFMLKDRPTLAKFRGLDLDRRTLGHLYNLNIKRAVDDQAKPDATNDLNRLLVALPPGAENVKNSQYRLLLACVASPRNPVEGLFSARLKNAITGALNSWREMTGLDEPMEIVTVPPLDRWLPELFGLDRLGRIEILPDVAAVQRRLVERPLTLALIPFGDVAPGMRVLSIDGENPALPYIRDCARRGGPELRNYFHNYPLFIPIASPQPPAPELAFRPHELRRITLAAQILPRQLPVAVKGETEKDPFTEPLYKIAGVLQTADLSLIAADAPFVEKCAAGDARPACLDRRWLNACDDLGVVGAAFPATVDRAAPAAWDENARRLQAHRIQLLRAGERPVAEFTTRGMRFAVVTEDARQPNWSAADAEKRIGDLARAGAKVFVYLYATTDANGAAAARALAAAGSVTAVIFVNNLPPRPIEWVGSTLIAYGLGDPAAAAAGEPGRTFIGQFTFYKSQLISVEWLGAEMTAGKMDFLHTTGLTKAYQEIFPHAAK